MIILSTPENLEKFIMVDEDEAFVLEQKGFHPQYMENGAKFFKRTNQLLKVIKKLGITEL